jgi:hypothetical protein
MTHQVQTKSLKGTNWGLYQKLLFFWYHETIVTKVHTLERAKLIDFKTELMNYVNFKERSFPMRYKVHSPQR